MLMKIPVSIFIVLCVSVATGPGAKPIEPEKWGKARYSKSEARREAHIFEPNLLCPAILLRSVHRYSRAPIKS
jgi:hypothetical protein